MNLRNHFLIAMPGLTVQPFRRAVVYICEHTEQGAMGLIINKVIDGMTVENVLSRLDINPQPRDQHIRLDKPVFVGGPLETDRGFILHNGTGNFASSIHIADDMMITTSRDVLETLGTAQQPSEIMVALGYASWQQGQLEAEIKGNAWLTVAGSHEILFHTPIHLRWQSAAKQLGINISTMSAVAGHA